MSDKILFNVTEKMRSRIGVAIGSPNQVHIGPPLANEIGQAKVSIFLFHIEVNGELRNQQRISSAPLTGMATEPGKVIDALPLDLRFLITVFRKPDNQVSPPNELSTLGKIYQELHQRPTLSGTGMEDQTVRVTPEPYPMEELSRVWGLFPQDVYRTSVVYKACPVFVEVGPEIAGPPVEIREQRGGISEDSTARNIAGAQP